MRAWAAGKNPEWVRTYLLVKLLRTLFPLAKLSIEVVSSWRFQLHNISLLEVVMFKEDSESKSMHPILRTRTGETLSLPTKDNATDEAKVMP